MATQFFASADGTTFGRFENLDLLDVAASREANRPRFRSIVVLREKATPSSYDDTVRKVRPEIQQALIERYPEAWQAFMRRET